VLSAPDSASGQAFLGLAERITALHPVPV
jgi:hypothetical protein